MPRTASMQPLSALPTTFTYAQARDAGLSKHALYRLREGGLIAAISRGLYRQAGAEPADTDLLAIAVKSPRATLCLETALARHGLSDAIPVAPDLALPRGTRFPATDAIARWHHFAPATFDIGREQLALDGDINIGIYDAPRSIIDAFRMRATEGHELGYEALRRWLRASGSQPGQLIHLAGQFPRAETPMRMALAALL
ncbi:MAG: hypothetical protein HHJ11_04430 [Phycicoccus sp.]|nr:hypothetical protein [Phycicoccus sp.]NMM32820.1 hypothetical protein [Phycicoccus sp.]